MKLMKRIIKAFYILLWRCVNAPTLWMNHVSLGKHVSIQGRLYLKTVGRKEKHSIYIGNNVNINSCLSANPIGGQNKTILYTNGSGRICIDDDVGISNSAIVSHTSIKIGSQTIIGNGTRIYDTDFHSIYPNERLDGNRNINTQPVTIGKRVFIGGHCLILKGVAIGDEAVIGAGSVVTKSVPAREIWAGNPAHYIRKLIPCENEKGGML